MKTTKLRQNDFFENDERLQDALSQLVLELNLKKVNPRKLILVQKAGGLQLVREDGLVLVDTCTAMQMWVTLGTLKDAFLAGLATK